MSLANSQRSKGNAAGLEVSEFKREMSSQGKRRKVGEKGSKNLQEERRPQLSSVVTVVHLSSTFQRALEERTACVAQNFAPSTKEKHVGPGTLGWQSLRTWNEYEKLPYYEIYRDSS